MTSRTALTLLVWLFASALRAQDVSAPETPRTSAPDAAEAQALTQGELESLGISTADGGALSALDTDVHVSGFLDFNVARLFTRSNSFLRSYLPRQTNFYVGNFNVYLTKQLVEDFRMLGEVRFSYLPNGYASAGTTSQGTATTTVPDYGNFERPMKWASIEIQRVYLEYSPHALLAVRAGQFLTPYGIWNVDHGSPVVIPVQRPYAVSGDLFPERQTGFELLGRWDATSHGTLGYHVTLSNGGGPINEYRDLDSNKALGARMYWEQHGPGEIKFGVSGYYGKTTDAVASLVVDSSGSLTPRETLRLQYTALAVAADVSWKWNGLHAQAELLARQRKYDPGGRVAVFNDLLQRNVFPADALSWGSYELIGYRFNWLGIMPYVMHSYLSLTDDVGHGTKVSYITAGLNARPVESVVVKLEYDEAFFLERLAGKRDPLIGLQAQLAWAF